MSETRPDGYLKNLNNAIAEAKRIMKKHKLETLPAQMMLRKLGYSRLGKAITRYHGGYHEFRDMIGQDQLVIKKGTWMGLEFAIQEAKEVMRKHEFETLPSQSVLQKLGYSMLSSAITNYHGGFNKFRELLGEEQLKMKNGTWKDIEFAIQEAKKVMEKHKLKTLPRQDKLQKLGYSSLAVAIQKYYGGFHKFRELLGEEQLREKRGRWDDLELTIQKAKEVMEKHGYTTLPGAWTLEKMGYSGLIHAISRYHGGLDKFKKILNQQLGVKSEKERLEELLRGYVK